jgi:hypothetical protein
MTNSTHLALLYSARALAVAWAVFWTWFGLASGIAEGLSLGGVLVHTAVPGLFFAVLAGVAWRWKTLGGILLTVAGVAVGVAYVILFGRKPAITVFLTLLTMAVPPIVAGILLLAHCQSSKP